MSNQLEELDELLKRAAAKDAAAMGQLFHKYHDQLRRMVRLRLDHRLQGRLDPSDVLQEAFLEYARALPEYLIKPDAPFCLWLRCITGRKLHALHRRYLGTRMRDAAREVSLHHGGLPEASSASLAAELLGKLTAPSQAALRAELQLHIQQALNEMEPMDREVLALRHYEQWSNRETACVLEISEAAASIRYIRALRRLKEHLKRVPGLLDDVLPTDVANQPHPSAPRSERLS
jgi:RNA polymerase sigma-70 factor (ECF subfamily)